MRPLADICRSGPSNSTQASRSESRPAGEGAPIGSPKSGARLRRSLRVDHLALVVLATAVLAFGAATNRFFSVDNWRAILLSASITGISALGATMIMICGSLVSLATAQTASLAAMVFLAGLRFGIVAALVLTVVFGLVVTALQGVIVGYWAANPVVLTIAAGFAIEAIATGVSGGASVNPGGSGSSALNNTPAGVPISVFVLFGLAALAQFVLSRTTVGRRMFLVGENRQAAYAAGLRVGRIVTVAWLFFGGCIAVSGVFLGAVNGSATASLGGNLSLDTAAAVIVGGTAISGGRGSAVQTLLGSVVIAAISDLLLLRGYSDGIQILARGLLILLVVTAVQVTGRRGRR